MSFTDDCRDHDVDQRRRSISIDLFGAEAELVRALARRLDLDPRMLVLFALASLAETHESIARR